MLNSALVWYLAWGLIPATLSILLFKLTKSTASVSTQKAADAGKKEEDAAPTGNSMISKLANTLAIHNPATYLVVNITGAAGLFILLFIIMNPIKTGFYEKESNWTLRVGFRDDKGALVPMNKLVNLDPMPSVKYDTLDGKSLLVFLNDLREENSKLKINYLLRVKFNGYETCTIPLSDSINEDMFCKRSNDKRCLMMNTIFLNSRIAETIAASADTVVKVSDKPIN
jgi:hypothetical protein